MYNYRVRGILPFYYQAMINAGYDKCILIEEGDYEKKENENLKKGMRQYMVFFNDGVSNIENGLDFNLLYDNLQKNINVTDRDRSVRYTVIEKEDQYVNIMAGREVVVNNNTIKLSSSIETLFLDKKPVKIKVLKELFKLAESNSNLKKHLFTKEGFSNYVGLKHKLKMLRLNKRVSVETIIDYLSLIDENSVEQLESFFNGLRKSSDFDLYKCNKLLEKINNNNLTDNVKYNEEIAKQIFKYTAEQENKSDILKEALVYLNNNNSVWAKECLNENFSNINKKSEDAISVKFNAVIVSYNEDELEKNNSYLEKRKFRNYVNLVFAMFNNGVSEFVKSSNVLFEDNLGVSSHVLLINDKYSVTENQLKDYFNYIIDSYLKVIITGEEESVEYVASGFDKLLIKNNMEKELIKEDSKISKRKL